jgi:hypothetical protein
VQQLNAPSAGAKWCRGDGLTSAIASKVVGNVLSSWA